MPEVRLQDPVSVQEVAVSVSVTACPHYFTSSTVQLSRVSVFRFLWLSEVMDELRVSRPVAASISSNTQRTEHPLYHF